MAHVYRIRDFGETFVVAQNGSCKSINWIAVPVKHDGKGYRRLMALENGTAIYGAWILIAAVAAKCSPRGTLFDDGEPLTAEDLHYKTGASESLLAEALEVLSSARIGWLERVELGADSEHARSTLGADSEHTQGLLELRDGTGRDITEQPVPVAGVSKKPKATGPKRSSIFANLTVDDLRDGRILADWFRAAAARQDPVIESSEVNLLNVFGAAIRSLKPGKAKKGPVAMFANIVRGARWGEITQSEEDEARKKITEEIKTISGLNGVTHAKT